MENKDRKSHWENVYEVKQPAEVSWYQPTAATSLQLIKDCNLPKDAPIIDVGGGDSYLAEALLKEGYSDITVLDISQKAIDRAKKRMGAKADAVEWIVCDMTNFRARRKYRLWHDRAAFHFLTDADAIENYKNTTAQAVLPEGYLITGTFSQNGPEKCSGLEITRYSAEKLGITFEPFFRQLSCLHSDHHTPQHKVQNFIFCRFYRINN